MLTEKQIILSEETLVLNEGIFTVKRHEIHDEVIAVEIRKRIKKNQSKGWKLCKNLRKFADKEKLRDYVKRGIISGATGAIIGCALFGPAWVVGYLGGTAINTSKAINTQSFSVDKVEGIPVIFDTNKNTKHVNRVIILFEDKKGKIRQSSISITKKYQL